MDARTYKGGCLCGQVRWRASGPPLNVRVCHCRLCQSATGGPFFARAMFAAESFERTGETTSWRTSERLARLSCTRCGTPMFALPNDAPRRIAVSLATCDDRHALRPECHIWVSEKVAWLKLDDRLASFERGFVAG